MLTHSYNPRRRNFAWNIYFYLLNLPLIWLLGLYYFTHGNWPTDNLGWVFTITAVIGQFALFGFLFTVVLSTIVNIVLPKPKLITPIAVLGALFTLIYFTVDSSVLLSYRFHLNGVILQMIFSSAFTQIFDFSWGEWLLAAIYIIAMIGLEIFIARWLWRKLDRMTRHRYAVITFAVILLSYLSSQALYAWCSAAYIYQGSTYAQGVMNASQRIPLYYGLTAKDFLLGHHYIVPQANANNELANLADSNTNAGLNYPLHPLAATPPKQPLNIMLIVLDTWRADMLTEATSPNIANFSKQAWNFTDHYSGGDCTEPGIFSLFYGVPASYWPSFLAAHRGPVLIDELLQQHYQLAVYASASLYKPDFYQSVFVNVPHLQVENPQPQPWQRDAYITQEMLQFLAQRDKKQPFFGFLFYDSIHEYDFPPNFHTRFNPWWHTINHLELTNDFSPTLYENRYKNSVLYVDSLVSQVLNSLQQQGLLQNTVVIITADHGEEFNDNHKNYWGHASNFSHYQMQTPFIVYWPQQSAKTYDHFTTHYDLVPLLMQRVLAVTNPPTDYTIGQPLLKSGNRSIIPVSSYAFDGFIEPQDGRITTLIGGGLYHVTNDKLETIDHDSTNIAHLETALEMMHRYYK
ncbi:MAG: DUF3413 domain-containing protein [Gammaproteobacteria bacterium]|nr:DUF3413 domain-containing protein [Gammaproteobacteria bacterium]